MADEQHEVRQINWKEVFGFTHIFKSFKMAKQPSKLILAFAAITLLFITGHVLDLFWSLGGSYVYDGEIVEHFAKDPARFNEDKEAWEDGRLAGAARLLSEMQDQRKTLRKFRAKLPSAPYDHFKQAFILQQADYEKDKKEAEDKFKVEPTAKILQDAQEKDRKWSALVDEADDLLGAQIDKIEAILDKTVDRAKTVMEQANLKTEREKDQAEDAIRDARQRAWQAITEIRVEHARDVSRIRGEKIFASLLDYELACVRNAVYSACQLNFAGGLELYHQRLAGRAIPALAMPPLQQAGLGSGAALTPRANTCGFAYWVLMGLEGGRWLISEHWVYGAILMLVSLAICALFGGAVHRIAALDFARDEKISIKQALKFSAGKFLSFFFAPLLPVAFILAAGGLLALGGLLGSIPYVGEIIMALLFLLALVVGILIAFLLIGLVGGVSLMYPTIAVEGSDSLDAMSRSFSYVFARPWRSILYGVVAAVYGAITYLFVRLFAYLALTCTHFFVKWGVWGQGSDLNPEADKLDILWTRPQFGQLFGPWSWHAMDGAEKIAATIIGVWVFLVAGLVAAYLLSYFASATTAIYFLLRRKEDATDLDDVYVEEPEEAPPAGEEAPAGEEEAPAEEEQAPAEDQAPAEGKPKRSRKKAAEGKADETKADEDKPA